MSWRIGALRWLVVFHLLGPTLFFFSVAYWLAKPDDWTGPAIIAPLSLAFAIVAQVIGVKAIRQATDTFWRTALITSQIAGPIGGLVIGIMLYFLIKQP